MVSGPLTLGLMSRVEEVEINVKWVGDGSVSGEDDGHGPSVKGWASCRQLRVKGASWVCVPKGHGLGWV